MSPSAVKAERPEDLNLPVTVVQRIIKESLPDGVIVSKEARQTICRASSVFVLYLTSCAVAHSNKSKRKTLAVNDIMSAIGEMEFDSFIQPLNEILQYRKNNIGQNSKSKPTAASKKDSKAEEEPEEVEEEEIEEQEEINGNEEVEDEVVEENLDGESGRKNKKRKTGLETANADDEEEPNEEKYTESSESEEEEPEERID